MSEMSRNARRAMRAKIHRLTAANHGKVDASDYGPEQVLDSEAKTGMRPVSRRAYKKGGKVVAVSGADAKKHAGKKPRSGSKHLTVDALVNRNYKDANEAREGKKHIGALKTGGRAMKKGGGGIPDVYTSSRPTDDSGRPISNKELNLGYGKDTPPAPKPTPKPVMRGKPMSVSEAMAGMRSGRETGGRTDIDIREKIALAQKLMEKERGAGGFYAKPKAGYENTDPGIYARPKAGEENIDPGIYARPKKSPYGKPLKHGGKAWEGSKMDEAQDAKLAKKRGMSMKEWEASKADDKHDKQKSMKGLKDGGGLYANIHAKRERMEDGSKEKMRKPGSKGAPSASDFKASERTARKDGGRTGKGKTNINIIIAPQHGGKDASMSGQPPMPMPPMPMPRPPMPMPAAAPAPMPMPMPHPGGMPPGLAAAMAGPAGGPVPPMPGGMPPMARKSGGKVYPKMKFGAGSGEGRLEKIEEYGQNAKA